MIELQGSVKKTRKLILDNGIIEDLSHLGFEPINSCHDIVRLKWMGCLDSEDQLSKAAKVLGGSLTGIDYWFRIAEFSISTDDIKTETSKPTLHIRKEAIREGELLYDRKGLIVAIERNGQLLAVLRGDE